MALCVHQGLGDDADIECGYRLAPNGLRRERGVRHDRLTAEMLAARARRVSLTACKRLLFCR